MQLGWSNFRLDEWGGTTLDQWATLKLEFVLLGLVWYTVAASYHLAGAEASHLDDHSHASTHFLPGSSEGKVSGPGAQKGNYHAPGTVAGEIAE